MAKQWDTTNRKGEEHHFFASSVAEWQVDTNLDGLIRRMKALDWSFNIFLVPGAIDTEYQIESFAPQVEGAVWLGCYREPQS